MRVECMSLREMQSVDVLRRDAVIHGSTPPRVLPLYFFLHPVQRLLVLLPSQLDPPRLVVPQLMPELSFHLRDIPNLAGTPRNLVHPPLLRRHPRQDVRGRPLVHQLAKTVRDLPTSPPFALARLVAYFLASRLLDRGEHFRGEG